ncbi:MAG TPA: hypothetical protein VHM30_19545 [Gemmatimonadaceae bacterium]|nr:hypothetical protein [Gemmatimonadaceae bacterium]
MDHDVQVFAQVMAIIVMTIASLIFVAGVTKFLFFRRSGPKPSRLAKEDDRLRRLEEAVDAIAVEVERISEGQRFTTRLLAERVPELEARARSESKSALS